MRRLMVADCSITCNDACRCALSRLQQNKSRWEPRRAQRVARSRTYLVPRRLMASGRHRTTSSCTAAHVYLLIDENPICLVRSVDDTAVGCWRTALPDATLCGTGQDRNQAAGSHAVASIGFGRQPFIQRFDGFELGLVEDLHTTHNECSDLVALLDRLLT